MTQGLKGDKRIPMASITAVQMKDPGFTNGYIQFSVLGGVESSKGVFDATKDENSVMFTKKQKADFEEIRDFVESQISRRGLGGSAPTGESATDKLRKLGDLRDSGVLTEDEFQAKKAQLLDEI